MEQVSKWLDWPPLWLALFLGLARLQDTRLPVGQEAGAIVDLLAGLIAGGGAVLIALAVLQMRQKHTTFVPHRDPAVLMTDGLFRHSRNPIYLGDTLVLTGLILFWGAWPSLLLVPLFVWVITDRFVAKEETRLAQKFGPAFETYAAKTRRWI